MSDSKYFVKVQDEDGRVSIKYSDTVYKETSDSTSEELELSKDYFIISTDGEPYGTTRSIIKGNFVFKGYELVGGTILGGITVLPAGQLTVANLLIPGSVTFGVYDPFKSLKDINNVIRLTLILIFLALSWILSEYIMSDITGGLARC